MTKEPPYNPRHARKETNTMRKALQFTARTALLMAATLGLFWLIGVLTDALLTLFPY